MNRAGKSIEAQFELFIPSLFDIVDPVNESPERTRLHALNILANLSLRESLRSTIMQNDGVTVFLAIIKR